MLRSSIREFLCSEALYHLGIPTTRAGSVVTSDTTVSRDMFYDGRPRDERATVITRIAPTFLRSARSLDRPAYKLLLIVLMPLACSLCSSHSPRRRCLVIVAGF